MNENVVPAACPRIPSPAYPDRSADAVPLDGTTLIGCGATVTPPVVPMIADVRRVSLPDGVIVAATLFPPTVRSMPLGQVTSAELSLSTLNENGAVCPATVTEPGSVLVPVTLICCPDGSVR